MASDGLVLLVTTRLANDSLTRREHFAVGCVDPALAEELLHACRPLTSDQTIADVMTMPAHFVELLCIQADEVRYLGCGPLESAANGLGLGEQTLYSA